MKEAHFETKLLDPIGELKTIIVANRKITVVDGQPWYESLGFNAVEKIWYPFICFAGWEHTIYPSQLPTGLDKDNIAHNINKHKDPSRFLHSKHQKDIDADKPQFVAEWESFASKYLVKVVHSKHEFKEEFSKYYPFNSNSTFNAMLRIGTKQNLIISSRLGGGHQYPQALFDALKLTQSEQKLARTPIKLVEDSTFVKESHGDIANEWLIAQGAQYIKKLWYNPNLVKTYFANEELISLKLTEYLNKIFLANPKLKVNPEKLDDFKKELKYINDQLKPFLDENGLFKNALDEKQVESVITNLIQKLEKIQSDPINRFKKYAVLSKWWTHNVSGTFAILMSLVYNVGENLKTKIKSPSEQKRPEL